MLPQSRTLIYAHSDTGTRLVADTLWNIGGGGGGVSCTKILGGFGFRKWHLQHSENTFRKKVDFQNTVLSNYNHIQKNVIRGSVRKPEPQVIFDMPKQYVVKYFTLLVFTRLQ